jgi:hypothetical protein
VDYKWNAEKGAYVKAYNDKISGLTTPNMLPKTNDTYTFAVSDPTRGRVSLEVTGAAWVTGFVFSNDGGVTEFTVENNGKDAFSFKLPYGWGDFSMKTTYTSSAGTLTIGYTEEIIGNNTSENILDVINARNKFASDPNVGPYIKSGIVFKYSKTE